MCGLVDAGGEIIVGNDKGKFGDKGEEDVESGDGVGGKDRDDVGKSSSREDEIVDKDDEKKMRKVEPQVPKVVTKLEVEIETM